jgi:hypothetical protein
VSVWVLPTNEELMIAQHTLALLGRQLHGSRPVERGTKSKRCNKSAPPLTWINVATGPTAKTAAVNHANHPQSTTTL